MLNIISCPMFHRCVYYCIYTKSQMFTYICIYIYTCTYIYPYTHIYEDKYICCCLGAHSCPTLCDPMHCSMPGFPVLHYLLELAESHVYWVNDAIQPSCTLYPLLLPSVFPSIRVFSTELAFHIRWLKYWNFSISPSNEYSGLISFRIDWFDFLAVQGTLRSLFQYHSSRGSILQHSAIFMVQLLHP